MATGIPVAVWAGEDHGVLTTCVELLRESERASSGKPARRRYSG